MSVFSERMETYRAKLVLKKFQSSNTNLDNDERGRPSTFMDDEELRQLFEDNPRTMIREIVQKLGVSIGIISGYLIGKSTKLDVPHELRENQKKSIMNSAPRFFCTTKTTLILITLYVG